MVGFLCPFRVAPARTASMRRRGARLWAPPRPREPGLRGLRGRRELTWKTIGPTTGPTASGCCSSSSTVPVRSPRPRLDGLAGPASLPEGELLAQDWRGAAHRGVPVGAGAGRLVAAAPRAGQEPTAVRAGRVAAGRRARRPRPDPVTTIAWRLGTCTWPLPGAGSGPSADGASRPRSWSTSASRPRWRWSGFGPGVVGDNGSGPIVRQPPGA